VRENLSGPLAQTVAGAFLYPTGSPELPPDERNQLTTAVTLMNTTRTTAETQSRGNSELDPYFFSTVPEHPSEIPGGFYGCMKAVAHMAPTALSAEDKALSERVPPFSRADWDTLRPIASRVVKSDENQGFFTARWISAVGPELLAKQRAVGRDLSLGEIWSIVTGDRRMPQGVTEANFGTRLHDHAKGMAAGIVRALRPGMDEDRIPRDAEVMLGECAEKLIPPKQLRELARPDAVLNLSDIHMDLRMSDLTGYTPENAYGLVKDYIRQSSHTMRLDPGDGSGMDFSSIPIPQEENKPDNPIFQGIIANVRRLCDGNEAQTARVLQAFSQAPLVTTSSFMTPFTGGEHPHYPFTVTATRLDTGQVRVDIKSKDSAPLEYNVQYLIEPDGSHACTDFKMKRR
jgi:hypothetical protein